jgi:hypothetical protein
MPTPAAVTFSFSCQRALPVIVGTLIAGAAWAQDSVTPPVPLDRAGIATDASNKPPPPPPITVARHDEPTAVVAEAPQGGSGSDARRLFMLMMMGRAMSGGSGPFGQFGQ